MSELPARGNADVDQLLGTLRGSPSADKHPNSHLKSSDFLIIAVFQLKPLFLETQYVGTNWQPSVGSFWFRVVSTTMWSWPRKAERSRNKAKWCCQMGANEHKDQGCIGQSQDFHTHEYKTAPLGWVARSCIFDVSTSFSVAIEPRSRPNPSLSRISALK